MGKAYLALQPSLQQLVQHLSQNHQALDLVLNLTIELHAHALRLDQIFIYICKIETIVE
ncbi:hypothetical protein Hanom_Chr00s002594g01701771 [Helianthus anomalus]